MVLEFLTFFVPLIWLVYRCIKLFQVPVSDIINDLNIDIPHTPNICVDMITSNSIVIHWDVQSRTDEHLYYILMVNNRETSTITSTSCKFSDLIPSTLYQLQVVTVNSQTHFRSLSEPVYVQTCSKDFDVDLVAKAIYSDNSTLVEDAVEVPKNLNESIINQIDDPKLLTDYLKHYQCQLVKVYEEFRTLESTIDKEFQKLHQDQLTLQQNSKDKSQNISKNSSILKENQKRKEELMIQKSKLIHKLNDLVKNREHKNKNLDSLESQLNLLKTKKQMIELHGNEDREKLLQKIDQTNQRIEVLKYNQDAFDEELKSIKIKRKSVNKVYQTLKNLIDEFNDSCFNKDHSLNQRGQEIIQEIISIKPNWQTAFANETKKLEDYEMAFRTALKTELKSFIATHNALESERHNVNKSYSPGWMSENSASQKYGVSGYIFGKQLKRRNRSRSNSKQQPQIVINGNGSSSPSSITSPGPGIGPGSGTVPGILNKVNTAGSLNSTGSGSGPGMESINPNYSSFGGLNVNSNPNNLMQLNNYYGDIYNNVDEEDTGFRLPNGSSFVNPLLDPPMTNLGINNGNNGSLTNPMNWNGQLNGISSPTMQSQQLHQLHSLPVPNLGPEPIMNDSLLGYFNHNVSTTSLGNRFSSQIWNPNNLNHTRSISGLNIWMNNNFAHSNPTSLETNEFRPFESNSIPVSNTIPVANPQAYRPNGFPGALDGGFSQPMFLSLSPSTSSPPTSENMGYGTQFLNSPLAQYAQSQEDENKLAS